ncbi:type II toxin-antitoxin system Phd/YefM family antitoxin [Photobacterium profundum]|uniref:Antitoxin n=1 Tax=Photobacterium profundum (strain SS9) TaxID=298386 RepID=Q6LIQ3_PHOPR|nr:type II toxin-antitoxin system Phd/YefM family antitoxin [Photobacterium profundum]CAG22827.1 conserved hypothetical protein [Photobacterium profundum SS9]
MEIYTYSEARQNLKSVMDKVESNCEEALIHRRDGENMVLMSESQYNGWVETMRIYSNPAQRKHIEESIEQFKSGDVSVFSLEELERLSND